MTLYAFFDKSERSLKDIEADLIVNSDKTNITDDPGTNRVKAQTNRFC